MITHKELEKALRKLFTDPHEAASAARALLASEDHTLLLEFSTMLKNAKDDLLADIDAHEEHLDAIRQIIKELKTLKRDADIDAFIIKIAKRLNKP